MFTLEMHACKFKMSIIFGFATGITLLVMLVHKRKKSLEQDGLKVTE